MAPAPFSPLLLLLLGFVLLASGIADPNPNSWLATDAVEEGLDRGGESSILSDESFSWHDYSPPSPPPPAFPEPPSCSCEIDLGGAGDFPLLDLERRVLLLARLLPRRRSRSRRRVLARQTLVAPGTFPSSILSDESFSWHDYSPPSPPPPAFPEPPSCSCETDLGGAGDFDTVCELHSSMQLSEGVYMKGNGTLELLADVVLSCPVAGCSIIGNLSGDVRFGLNSGIVAGTVRLAAANITVQERAVVNTTALAGDPPPQTSGRPVGTNGDGGGHGGRGASCVVKEGQTQEDSWGGDAYSWSSLAQPDSYGSKGGTTSREEDYGGAGGGRVWLLVKEFLWPAGVPGATAFASSSQEEGHGAVEGDDPLLYDWFTNHNL